MVAELVVLVGAHARARAVRRVGRRAAARAVVLAVVAVGHHVVAREVGDVPCARGNGTQTERKRNGTERSDERKAIRTHARPGRLGSALGPQRRARYDEKTQPQARARVEEKKKKPKPRAARGGGGARADEEKAPAHTHGSGLIIQPTPPPLATTVAGNSRSSDGSAKRATCVAGVANASGVFWKHASVT